jgi:hypothetical protein
MCASGFVDYPSLTLLPPKGISFTGSSTDGTTSWQSRGNKMMVQAVDGRYTIDLHVTVNGVVLEGSCTISAPQVRYCEAWEFTWQTQSPCFSKHWRYFIRWKASTTAGPPTPTRFVLLVQIEFQVRV